MKKFYIHVGGGVGDMIKNYFWGHHGWQYLDYIKNKYPDAIVKLVVTCCNPAGAQLFESHPLIDKTLILPWQDPNKLWKDIGTHTQNYSNLSDTPKTIGNKIKQTRPKRIPLSEEDEREIAKYKPKEKYIVIHPFAGQNPRMHLSVEKNFLLAKIAAKEFNCKIIIVGGTSQRTIGPVGTIEEDFPYSHPDIINLVNKTNLKVAVELTREATYFVGTNSCFFCVRLSTETPSTVYMNTQREPEGYNPKTKCHALAIRNKADQEATIERVIQQIKKSKVF